MSFVHQLAAASAAADSSAMSDDSAPPSPQPQARLPRHPSVAAAAAASSSPSSSSSLSVTRLPPFNSSTRSISDPNQPQQQQQQQQQQPQRQQQPAATRTRRGRGQPHPNAYERVRHTSSLPNIYTGVQPSPLPSPSYHTGLSPRLPGGGVASVSAVSSPTASDTMERGGRGLALSGDGIRRVKSASALTALGSLSSVRANTQRFVSPEYVMVTEKLRAMQMEIGRLTRKLREEDHESVHTLMVVCRRGVFISNLLLAFVTFVSKSLSSFQAKIGAGMGAAGSLALSSGAGGASSSARFQHPRFSSAASAAAFALQQQQQRTKRSILDSLYSATRHGFKSALPFLIGFGFLRGDLAWKRNLGFIITSTYSAKLALSDGFLPWANALSVGLNCMYVIARHYYLHGLLSFAWVGYLH